MISWLFLLIVNCCWFQPVSSIAAVQKFYGVRFAEHVVVSPARYKIDEYFPSFDAGDLVGAKDAIRAALKSKRLLGSYIDRGAIRWRPNHYFSVGDTENGLAAQAEIQGWCLSTIDDCCGHSAEGGIFNRLQTCTRTSHVGTQLKPGVLVRQVDLQSPVLQSRPSMFGRLAGEYSRLGGRPSCYGVGYLTFGDSAFSGFCGIACVNKRSPDEENARRANNGGDGSGPKHPESPLGHFLLGFQIALSALIAVSGVAICIRGFHSAGDSIEAALDGRKVGWFGVLIGFGLIFGGACLSVAVLN